MRQGFALLFSTLSLIGSADAATALRLRAGEHGDFSRVVAPSLGAPPLVLASGRQISLIFDASVEAVDLGEIDDRRAARIASAAQSISDGKLVVTFTLNCDCAPKLSSGADGALVLDIYGAAPPAPEPPATAAQTEAERARARLMTAIAGASSSGVVRLKGAAADAPSEAVKGPTPLTPASLETPAPDIETPIEARDCSLENDLIAAAEEVDHHDTEESPEDLALAYLKRGFFAESHAVARAGAPSVRLAVIAAIAGALDGRPEPQAATLSAFAACGPAHRLMQATARAIEAPADRLDLLDDAFGILEKMPAPLRFSLAEALAHAAHKQHDAGAARFAAIARAAEPRRASVKLDIVEAAGGPLEDAAHWRVAKAARDPGADQLQAIDALGDRASPSPSERTHAIADLALAARLSASDTARLEAAERAAALLAADARHAEAVAVFASAHFESSDARARARDAAASLLLKSIEKGEGADVISAAAGFFAHRQFLADAASAPALRVALARGLAPLGDARLAEELLADPRVASSERAAALETTSPLPVSGAHEATRPAFAAFANERLMVSPKDPESAVRQARRLDEEAALMRKALAGDSK